MKIKHATSPWEYGLAFPGAGEISIRSERGILASTSERLNIVDGKLVVLPPTEEDWANARLMAAAPDLLEACYYSLRALEEINDENDLNTVLMLRDAIAKAEGRDE